MTESTTSRESDSTFEDIEKRVLEPFDLDDIAESRAVNLWRAGVEKVRAAVGLADVTHRFSAPQVHDAAVEFFKTEIREYESIHRLKVAEHRSSLALKNLVAMLGEHDGIFPDDEEDQRVVPEILSVVTIRKSTQRRLFKQVVQASRDLARAKGDDGEIPFATELGDGIKHFKDDLHEFIESNGDHGRAAVVRVCEDREFAETVNGSEEWPKPLRFLARIVVQGASTSRLPEQERKIGFDPASH